LADHELLVRFASECDAVTLESEFLDEEDLLEIERAGHVLFPRTSSFTTPLSIRRNRKSSTATTARRPPAEPIPMPSAMRPS
jgi:phosphoribosylaminoimidazole carboxylase (NCAIR synthetase)